MCAERCEVFPKFVEKEFIGVIPAFDDVFIESLCGGGVDVKRTIGGNYQEVRLI